MVSSGLDIGAASEAMSEEVPRGEVLIVVNVVCRIHGGPRGQKLSHGLERQLRGSDRRRR